MSTLGTIAFVAFTALAVLLAYRIGKKQGEK